MSDIEKAKEIIFISMMDEINTSPKIPTSKTYIWDVAFERLSELLIPQSGCADTLVGELLRACRHIQYRWVNDGDSVFSGDPDIVIPDFLFIACHCNKHDSKIFFEKLRKIYQDKNKQEYERFIIKGNLAYFIVNAIIEMNWDWVFENNDKDSRSCYEVDENFDICDPDLYQEYYDKDNNGYQRDAYDEMAWWCKSHSDKWDTEANPEYHTDITLTINEKGLEWIQNKKKEYGMI